MRLQSLAEATVSRDFEPFVSTHFDAVKVAPDALDRVLDKPWGSSLSLDSHALSAGQGFSLPPETADQKRQRVEREISLTAPAAVHLDNSVSDADLDKRLADLEANCNVRAVDYQIKGVFASFGTAFGGGSGLKKTYSDLTAAMRGDVAELAGWRNMTHDQKVELFNRVSREANMEVKYNINIASGDKNWTEGELNDLDAGLAKIPSTLVLDDDQLGTISRFSALKDGNGKDIYAQTLNANGEIQFTDLGVGAGYRYKGVIPAVTETIMHEIGHHFDNENPRWKEFMAISGWRDVGADTDFSSVPNGPVKGKDIGITDDPEGDYVVSRQYNRTFAHKAGAEFGIGDYTRQNPYDDFAETFMQYMQDPDGLKANAPQKYAFIKQFLADRDSDYKPGYVID
jgi:hypothetical protein